MKNIHKILAGLLVLTLGSSCNDFLTVNPKTEVARDALFSTEDGFKDAMAGVYIQMGEDVAYGRELTMTSIEHLVSSWDVTALTPADQLGQFNYSDAGAERVLEGIFNHQYKTISSINAMLNEIDAKKAIFSPGIYELIKGECLALRGLLHFDMLRLFGPVPSAASAGHRLPPYVTVFSKVSPAPLNYAGFKTALFNDLEEAEQLLAKSDPFLAYGITDFRNNTYRTKDDFVHYRYLRMNYYAVKAMKARAYLWFNEPQKAYEQATFVINAKNTDASAKFRLGTSADFAANDLVLTPEQIFGLYDFNINTKFVVPTLFKGTDAAVINGQLYGNTGTDTRESNLWITDVQSSVSRYMFRKYNFTASSTNLMQDAKQIPMLRLSEMYLIAIETGAQADAQNWWDAFQTARNVGQSTLPTDTSQKQALLAKEYRKEFYGEGQAFYAYKRLNAPAAQITFLPVGVTVDYVPPLPKSETAVN